MKQPPPLVFAWPLVLTAIVCCQGYESPCSARPGFDQPVRPHMHADGGPGVVYLAPPRHRAELAGTLTAVAQALRDGQGEQRVDVLVDIPLAFFEGYSCEQLLQPFDKASACKAAPTDAMISFYYYPPIRSAEGVSSVSTLMRMASATVLDGALRSSRPTSATGCVLPLAHGGVPRPRSLPGGDVSVS
jgi:hypothetical protein